MTITRKQIDFTFSDGRQVVVHEANWDIATEKSAQESQARTDKAKLNGSGDPAKAKLYGSGDPALLYFREMIYPYLGPCTSGMVPSVEDAMQLPSADLDGWLEVVRVVNSDWLPPTEETEESIEFRDGSKLTVLPTTRPSVLMRLQRLELQADQGTPETTVTAETFRLLYYPKMAGCSIGDVPTLEAARDLPESELDKWYGAVRRVNPSLFRPLEQMAEANQAAMEATEKKSWKRRSRS